MNKEIRSNISKICKPSAFLQLAELKEQFYKSVLIDMFNSLLYYLEKGCVYAG